MTIKEPKKTNLKKYQKYSKHDIILNIQWNDKFKHAQEYYLSNHLQPK